MRYKKGRQFGKCFEVFFMGGESCLSTQNPDIDLFFFTIFIYAYCFLTLMAAFEINENPGMLM